ncbi:hypothetical protein C8Q80DRAFT_1115882 [Daedaleopsis nitida]|nr:hypothetical protein C8Q80DRAFT_1115882 [Daedaleopsis nitida]
MAGPIVFYDIPCNIRGQTVGLWGNALKTSARLGRLVLNCLEAPSLQDRLAAPLGDRANLQTGRHPSYVDLAGHATVYPPRDPQPKTGATYPDTSRCVPVGTDAFHAMFKDALGSMVLAQLGPLIMPLVPNRGVPRGAAEQFGVKLEEMEMSPQSGAARKRQWAAAEAAFGKVAAWMDGGGQMRTRFMGDVDSYADLIFAAMFICLRRVVGEETVAG